MSLIPQSPNIFQDLWLQVIASEAANIVPGNCLPLRWGKDQHQNRIVGSLPWHRNIPVGSIIHNIEIRPGRALREDGEHMTGNQGLVWMSHASQTLANPVASNCFHEISVDSVLTIC